MDSLIALSGFLSLMGGIISIIVLIVFFIMANNVGKSTKLLRAILHELRKTEIDKKAELYDNQNK